MKKFISTALLLITASLFCSCGNKNSGSEEVYVNPVFKENLTEVYDIFLKRYTIDYAELKTKFGIPVKTVIDSVLSGVNQQTYDSTFTFYYKNITFHYTKQSVDKKYISTGVELTGQFKAKQFTIIANETKEEVLALFGEPVFKKNTDNSEELTYALYKDESGTYYDSIILIFTEDKFTGLRYEPYLENSSETTNADAQQENTY